MKPAPRLARPSAKPLTLGLDGFARISAIEGIRLSTDSQRMFADFERDKLSPEQRRRAIAAKHANKG